MKLSDGVSVDGSSGTKTAGSAIYSEVEVRAMNVKDCDTGELWVQYVEILIGGYVVRLERIQGAKVAPSLATVRPFGFRRICEWVFEAIYDRLSITVQYNTIQYNTIKYNKIQ